MDNNIISLIKCIFTDDDIGKILTNPLATHFTIEKQHEIRRSVDKFLQAFLEVENERKYDDFIDVIKEETTEWIPRIINNTIEAKQNRIKFGVIFELLHVQSEEAVKAFPMNEPFVNECCSKKLISERVRDNLIATIKSKGETTAKYEFLWQLTLRSKDCYSLLLQILHRNKTCYIENCCDDLHKGLAGLNDQEANDYIEVYARSIIELNLNAIKNDGDSIKGNVQFDGAQGQGGDKTCVPMEATVTMLPSQSGYDVDSKKDGENFTMFCEENSNNREKDVRSKVKDNVEFDNTEGQGGDKTCVPMEATVTMLPSQSAAQFKEDSKEESSSSEDGVGDEDDGENNTGFDEMYGELQDKSVDDLLNFSSIPSAPQVGATAKLEPRNYQTELAQEGITGKNVLICAPTGSGKTIVAVKIVKEHLQKNPKGKVAFIVHRIALVEQQYAQFTKYLKCKITRLSGSIKSSSTPLIGHIPSFDVFVMTSDILRNALEQDNETKLQSVSAFSMILFDECHNCDKKHPYNRIMNHYFKTKKEGSTVPQIIGLTASTGTNKANTMAKAMKRLFTLCANLDTYVVSTVKECLEDLVKNQSTPLKDIKLAEPRLEDKFEVELQEQMKCCETHLLEMNKRGFFPKDSTTQLIFSIPEDRMHQKYANFVGKLSNLLNNTKQEYKGRESIYAISQYLNAFSKALMVNHLFRAQDAIKLIKDSLSLDKDSQPACPTESALRKRLRKLEKGHLKQTDNPCLKTLQDVIEGQLHKDPSSRIIVFVRERTYTQILKDVFTSLNNPKIKCDTIVGNTISAEKGGLTQNEMEEVLGRFKSGVCNVLFSTTVAEEGLDVQKCNLVIRYGHVTNETAMVQSRGRARAMDSTYLVIVPNKLQWQINKENINIYRESMMYKAITKFQEMDISERDKEIEECKFERQLLETIDKTKKISLESQINSKKVRTFHCLKCGTIICESGDIRLAENAHHIVIKTAVFDKMIVNHQNNQIHCKTCSNKLGSRQIYKGRAFPNLSISAFSLICEGEIISKSYKKWRDIDFEVANVSNKELLDFPSSHSLST